MRLIINADDFGIRPAVDQAIISLVERGLVRSVSLLVDQPNSQYATDFLRTNPSLGSGLHLNLDTIFKEAGFGLDYRGRFLVPELFFESGSVREAVRDEVRRQLDLFSKTGRMPDHVNGHRDVHLYLPVLRILLKELNLCGTRAIRYKSNFYDAVSVRTAATDLLEQFSFFYTDNLVYGPDLSSVKDGFFCEMAVELSLDLPVEELSRIRQYKFMVEPAFHEKIEELGLTLSDFGSLSADPALVREYQTIPVA